MFVLNWASHLLPTDTVDSSSEGKTGLYGPEYKLYTELWFIILMAFLGLAAAGSVNGSGAEKSPKQAPLHQGETSNSAPSEEKYQVSA